MEQRSLSAAAATSKTNHVAAPLSYPAVAVSGTLGDDVMSPTPPPSATSASCATKATTEYNRSHRAVHVGGKQEPRAAVSSIPRVAKLRVLVLVPKSCVLQWDASCKEWIQPIVFHSNDFPPPLMTVSNLLSGTVGSTEKQAIANLYRKGGILVLGYEQHGILLSKRLSDTQDVIDVPEPISSVMEKALGMLRIPAERVEEGSRPSSFRVKLSSVIRGVDLVLLDESHRLRSSDTKSVQILRKELGNVPLRLALTGTPLQNKTEVSA